MEVFIEGAEPIVDVLIVRITSDNPLHFSEEIVDAEVSETSLSVCALSAVEDGEGVTVICCDEVWFEDVLEEVFILFLRDIHIKAMILIIFETPVTFNIHINRRNMSHDTLVFSVSTVIVPSPIKVQSILAGKLIMDC